MKIVVWKTPRIFRPILRLFMRGDGDRKKK